jgi:hypothetical protein
MDVKPKIEFNYRTNFHIILNICLVKQQIGVKEGFEKMRKGVFLVFCVLAAVSTMFLAGSVMASAMPALRTDKPLKTPLEQQPFPWPNWGVRGAIPFRCYRR